MMVMPKTSKDKHNLWVDNVKVFACLLVALGHFFKSMVASQMISESYVYTWFVETIYWFHVPLFFICSGYLYQKYSQVNSFGSWKSNVIKKLLNLGIPYVVFSIATWTLKNIFSGDVNTQNDASMCDTLFNQPLAPYWYLYALFFIFLITPTFSNKTMAFSGVFIALNFKVVYLLVGELPVYMVSTVLNNEIWFVFGMLLAFFEKPIMSYRSKLKRIGLLGIVIWLGVSFTIPWFHLEADWLSFLMGIVVCATLLMVFINFSVSNQWIKWLCKYTMPIFLMHTIFAAGLRSVLFRLGIENLWIHLVVGIGISIIGPMMAAKIMELTKLDVLYAPGKYIKLKKEKGKNNG